MSAVRALMRRRSLSVAGILLRARRIIPVRARHQRVQITSLRKGFDRMELAHNQTMMLTRRQHIASWTLRVIVAVILLQTLFFKFSGAAESVYIFSTLGAEPWGRIGSGAIELIASALLLFPRTVALGALLSLGTISGAILAHLTRLGIALAAVDDHGELFALAVVVFIGSALVLFIHRREIPVFGKML